MEEANANRLEIQMLGGFTLHYQGKECVIGRNSMVKYIQLLQIVLVRGEEGITKEQIMNSLYDRASLMDSNNSFSNLLYQLRKQMVQAGLPKAQYVVREGRHYVPDSSIPLELDTAEFETCMKKAAAAREETEKYGYCKKAFDLYRGELLPELSTEMWVMVESIRYKEMYNRCVKWLGEYLKKKKNYEWMGEIYSRAARIYPFDEWQLCQIDSLIYRGDYQEAYKVYDRTVNLYLEELGEFPSERMINCCRNIECWMKNESCCLSEITKEFENLLKAEDKEARGIQYCSFPSFVDIYGLVKRNQNHNETMATMFLCTLVDYEGKTVKNCEKRKKGADSLERAIKESISSRDIYTRYSQSQYLILVIRTEEQKRLTLQNEIKNRLRELAGSCAHVICSEILLDEIPVIEN